MPGVPLALAAPTSITGPQHHVGVQRPNVRAGRQPPVVGLVHGLQPAEPLGGRFDGPMRGVRIASWPSILALQEASQAAGTATTQGQDVVRGSGTYRIAATDLGDQHVSWTGNYIAYKTSAHRAVGHGGHWMLGSPGVVGVFDAVYQEFRSQQNPAVDFLVVDTHLPSDDRSLAVDQLRFRQTAFIVQKARALAAARGGIPVVYAGDFNSSPSADWHPVDGPQAAMRNANVASETRSPVSDGTPGMRRATGTASPRRPTGPTSTTCKSVRASRLPVGGCS